MLPVGEPEPAALGVAVLVGAEEDERPARGPAARRCGGTGDSRVHRRLAFSWPSVNTTTRLSVGAPPACLGAVEQQRGGVEQRRVAARLELVRPQRDDRRDVDVVEQRPRADPRSSNCTNVTFAVAAHRPLLGEEHVAAADDGLGDRLHRAGSVEQEPDARARPSARRLAEELTDDARGERIGARRRARRRLIQRSGSELAPDAAPDEGSGERGERVGVAGHRRRGRDRDARVTGEGTRRPPQRLATVTAASLVERHRGEHRVGIDRIELRDGRHHAPAPRSRPRRPPRLDRDGRRRVGDRGVDAGEHRTTHRVVREHEAGGDGATDRAVTERAGSRLEPRKAGTAAARPLPRSPGR